jgi:hypothetical protein
MPTPYTPSNWYWRVAASDTQVYSSAAGNFVPVADATYQAWLGLGNAPTNILSDAELGEVLAPYSLRPVTAAVLEGYTEAQAVKLTVETVAKILFNHENRIRTIVGQPTVTAAQFKSFIKSQM